MKGTIQLFKENITCSFRSINFLGIGLSILSFSNEFEITVELRDKKKKKKQIQNEFGGSVKLSAGMKLNFEHSLFFCGLRSFFI